LAFLAESVLASTAVGAAAGGGGGAGGAAGGGGAFAGSFSQPNDNPIPITTTHVKASAARIEASRAECRRRAQY